MAQQPGGFLQLLQGGHNQGQAGQQMPQQQNQMAGQQNQNAQNQNMGQNQNMNPGQGQHQNPGMAPGQQQNHGMAQGQPQNQGMAQNQPQNLLNPVGMAQGHQQNPVMAQGHQQNPVMAQGPQQNPVIAQGQPQNPVMAQGQPQNPGGAQGVMLNPGMGQVYPGQGQLQNPGMGQGYQQHPGMGQGFNPNPVMGQGPVFHQGIQNQGMFGQGINPMGQWPGQDQGQGIGQNLGMGQGNVPVQNWVGGPLQPGPWRPDQLGMVTQGSWVSGHGTDLFTRGSLTGQLIKGRDSLVCKAKKASTWKTYNKIDSLLLDFWQTHNLNAYPADGPLTSLFVAFLGQKYSPASVRTFVSALAYKYKLAGLPDPTKHFIVSETLQGLTVQRPPQNSRLPITQTLLQNLIAACQRNCTYYEGVLYSAMYTTAFYALLRVGEMVNEGTGHTILWKNVNYDNVRNTIHIQMDSYKHSKPGMGQVLTIYPQLTRNVSCPVQTLLTYLQNRPNGGEELFLQASGKSVSRKEFTTVLYTLQSTCNINIDQYKGHSFRIGGATYAASLGYSDAQIRKLGRWKTDAFKKYLR